MVGSVLQILTCQCCVGVCSTGSFLERFVTFCVFNPEQVSVGKVLLGVFGVAVVVILIAVPTAIFLNEEKGGNQRSFTLEDVFNSSLRPKSFGMRWISGGRCPGSPAQQITFNGKENFILNGIPDWVYEEEMFSSSQGLWWSPGGKYVAYAEFNDTGVHNIEYSWYGENQYPSTVSIPYPKPGTPNPVVKLFVVDTDNTTKITEVCQLFFFLALSEHYLATVTWVTDNRIAVQWLKRVQNHLILQIYNLSESRWDPIEFSPPEPVFAEDKASYYLLMSDTKKYKHIHHVVGVGIFLHIDSVSVCVFNRWTKQGTKCLTCTLHGEKCQYNSAYFSHNASFYRLSCSGPGIPYHSIMDNRNDKELKVLENNTAFSNLISDLQMPSMRRGTIKVAGYNLWYQMFLPPGFDESKKYPLLIDVYAGPCSQKADFTYRVSWSTYLASTEKIIVASFDGRGSGFQGDQLMHEIYKRLGTYEVEDQITAAKEFIKMGFIDKDRVAIWGWSYGGYVTSMALGAGSGVFKCGMAVAPVSKWVYYDSIYTERYMMEPSENPDAYLNSTVTARAKNFHSVQYLLVHGTADDNVHFQQAAEISEALVEEQVDFEAMWYTDKDHGLEGSAHQHVYTHMSHFLLRCFA
uniref:Dipeptidyl-peptidase 4 n=1 Tax=Lates calcarifer TaxID=8187 RepID=A0A4W6BTU8_LATCA